MAVPSEYSLLQTPWSVHGILEHFDIVVGFKHEHVRRANAFYDESRDVTEISEKPDVHAVGAKQVTHGILRIVRDHKRLHLDVADVKSAAGCEQPPFQVRLGRQRHGILRRAIAVNRNPEFFGKN